MALEVNFYAGTRDQYDAEPALDAGGLYALIDGLGLYRGAQPVAGPCPFDIKLTDLTPSGDNTDKIKIFDGFWESDTYVLDLLQFFESIRSGPGGKTLRVSGSVYPNSLAMFVNSNKDVADLTFYKSGRRANFYSIEAFPTDNQKTAQPVDTIAELKFTVLLQHLVLYEDYSCRLAQCYYLVLDSTETQMMLNDLQSLLESKILDLATSTSDNLTEAESRLRTSLDDVATTAQANLEQEQKERSFEDKKLSIEITANKLIADNEFATIREEMSTMIHSAKLYWETI